MVDNGMLLVLLWTQLNIIFYIKLKLCMNFIEPYNDSPLGKKI